MKNCVIRVFAPLHDCLFCSQPIAHLHPAGREAVPMINGVITLLYSTVNRFSGGERLGRNLTTYIMITQPVQDHAEVSQKI